MTVHPQLAWFRNDLHDKMLPFCDKQMKKYTSEKDTILYTTHQTLTKALLDVLDRGESVRETWRRIEELEHQNSPEAAEEQGRPWGFAEENGHWFLTDEVRNKLEPALRCSHLI